jgi:hypothetical protein
MSGERRSEEEKPVAETVGLNGTTGIWQWKRSLLEKSRRQIFLSVSSSSSRFLYLASTSNTTKVGEVLRSSWHLV